MKETKFYVKPCLFAKIKALKKDRKLLLIHRFDSPELAQRQNLRIILEVRNTEVMAIEISLNYFLSVKVGK